MPRLDFYAEGNHRSPFVKVSLHEEDVTLGRSSDCTVQLPNERVSRHHATIRHREGEWWIEDASRHGTRLNATMVHEPRRLQTGDRIYIESFVIVFQADDVPPQDIEEAITGGDE